MSSRYGPSSRHIWTLAGSGLGTVIAGTGNSGNWQPPAAPPWTASQETPVDLRDVNDIALMVSIAAIVSTPTLTVNLDLYDDQGNLYLAAVSTGAITPSGATTKMVSAGAHGASAGTFVIFPDWGRMSWTCTGGSVTGVQIGLWAR